MMITGVNSLRTVSKQDPPLSASLSSRPCRRINGRPKTCESGPLFSIARTRLHNVSDSDRGRRKSVVSLPDLSRLLHVSSSEESDGEGTGTSDAIVNLPLVDDTVPSVFAIESDVSGGINNRVSACSHEVELDTSELIKYQPLPKGSEKKHVTRQRYRNIRSAIQYRERSLVRSKSKSHSARRPRRENEERYLQARYQDKPCSRVGSFLQSEMLGSVTDLCRECCDVLGPRNCHECDRITQRQRSKSNNERIFPSIHISPTKFSTMELVQKMFPHLTKYDVFSHLDDGNILTEVLQKEQIKKRSEERRIRCAQERNHKVRERISAFEIPNNQEFFKDFSDLRLQIFSKKKIMDYGIVRPISSLPVPTEIEMCQIPEEERKNPANYYAPPIMSQEEIERQRSQPRFYAGCNQEAYTLPKTPRALAEAARKSTKAMREMDSSSSMNFGIIEEEEEDDEEERPIASSSGKTPDGQLSSSASFYQALPVDESLESENNLNRPSTSHRGQFVTDDDLLDTDKFFGAEAANLDSESDMDSDSSPDEDDVEHRMKRSKMKER